MHVSGSDIAPELLLFGYYLVLVKQIYIIYDINVAFFLTKLNYINIL